MVALLLGKAAPGLQAVRFPGTVRGKRAVPRTEAGAAPLRVHRIRTPDRPPALAAPGGGGLHDPPELPGSGRAAVRGRPRRPRGRPARRRAARGHLQPEVRPRGRRDDRRAARPARAAGSRRGAAAGDGPRRRRADRPRAGPAVGVLPGHAAHVRARVRQRGADPRDDPRGREGRAAARQPDQRPAPGRRAHVARGRGGAESRRSASTPRRRSSARPAGSPRCGASWTRSTPTSPASSAGDFNTLGTRSRRRFESEFEGAGFELATRGTGSTHNRRPRCASTWTTSGPAASRRSTRASCAASAPATTTRCGSSCADTQRQTKSSRASMALSSRPVMCARTRR